MAKKLGTPLEDRFINSFVPEPNSGCWLWDGVTQSTGYGTIYFDKKTYYAHRYSWEFHNGPIPKGLEVCHKCDLPCCVNPDHLFLGTHKENMIDMYSKGRNVSRPGTKHHAVKLTEDQVREIFYSHDKYEAISLKFGVHIQTVYKIKSGIRWSHLNLTQKSA